MGEPETPIVDERERRLAAHLHRAGELLKSDEVEAADAEVKQALALRPDDLRARNLLGLVLFRSGRHEEALALYHQLIDEDPADPALRLNLGLVELRLGKHDEAAISLGFVVEREPNNQRAHGYLGLALMRSGELARAREALLLAAQPELVKQVEEKMASEARDAEEAVSEVRRTAERGLQQFERQAQPFGRVEEQPHDGRASDDKRGGWQVRTVGAPLPPPGPEGSSAARVQPLPLAAPLALSEFATARLLRPARLGEPFALAEGGMLVVRIDGRLPTRTLGAIASTGQLTFEPMTKRVRGRASDLPFGVGPEAMFAAQGQGLIIVAPRGAKFTALHLKDDILYVRESALFAFEESLHWENGRVPGGAESGLTVVQLRGQGRCVLRADRAAFCVKIEPKETLYIGQDVLLGWIGRVVPRQLKGSDGEPTPYVEATGEGALILEEPAPL